MIGATNLRPIGIDLFSGAGGMSLGFEQAGFDVAAAVEVDPIHCAVHKYNFPHTTIIPRSVTSITGADIREAAGLGKRTVHCVFGGPPCQGFSMIGQRSMEDPRNRLVLDFVRIVAELGAETFVFENVKGLTVGRHRAFLQELVQAFEKEGYRVRMPWSVLNAANFGVPQHRHRLILIGAKKALPLPAYPQIQTLPADESAMDLGLPTGPSVGDALRDIPNADRFQQLLDTDSVEASLFDNPSRYASELRCEARGAWHFGYRRVWRRSLITSSARTDHSVISRTRFSETGAGCVEPISRFFKLKEHGLSNTLRAGTDGARGAFTSPRPIHYKHPRCITVREMARLHGFPDWFRFHATKWHGARQVGNAVPPPLARAIASCLIKSFAWDIEKPNAPLKLGDTTLLQMELNAAATYFGIPKPNSRRDMKSGRRKRSQQETERMRLAKRTA
ncbi:MAG: DNA cytosine methyltransferase [Steroidobacteraceae bacterium]